LCGDIGVLLLMTRMVPEPTIADELFDGGGKRRAALLELLGTPGDVACVAMAGSRRGALGDAYRRRRGGYSAISRRPISARQDTGPLWPSAPFGFGTAMPAT
jgi:hypothetical protein